MRILILGTGGMANQHAKHFAAIEGVTLAGGVDVDPARVEAFCATHKIERGFGSLDAAIAWGEFDAVANVTPDSVHYPTTMAALAAGKHVFCEKPLATDHARALEMTETAERLGLINMVNLTYRNVAQLQKAREIVQSGQVGTVKHFEASYLQSWLVSKAWGDWRTESQWLWRLSKKHGSNGVLGDIGVHILDFAAYGAGSDFSKIFCRLETFDKAEGNRIGEYDLDANDSFAMTAQLENGALGVVHASRWATGHFNELRLRVYGSWARWKCSTATTIPSSSPVSAPMPKRGPGPRSRCRRCPPTTSASWMPSARGRTSSRASAMRPISRRCSIPPASPTAIGMNIASRTAS